MNAQPPSIIDYDDFRANLPANRIELFAMTTPSGEWLFTVGRVIDGETQLLDHFCGDYSEAILVAGRLEAEFRVPAFDFVEGQRTWGVGG